MSSAQRREQLISVGRRIFAEKGLDATSVEEVAARAKVSKPVVYEHFGGKEGSTPLWSTARSGRCWTASRTR
jgi:AcrR family transcriptional regulator